MATQGEILFQQYLKTHEFVNGDPSGLRAPTYEENMAAKAAAIEDTTPDQSTKVKELLLDKEFEALFGDTRANVEQKIAQGISITGEPINTATPNHGEMAFDQKAYETAQKSWESLINAGIVTVEQAKEGVGGSIYVKPAGSQANAEYYETVAQATEALPLSEFDSTPLLFGAGGFALGALVAVLACRIKIKKIKAECETRVSEARDSLDRMISIMAKE